MAVYTQLTHDEIVTHLKQYDLGELVRYQGIQEGVSNTNFLVVTTKDRYILTLFEKRTDPKDLPYFIGIMEHLAAKGIDCPLPIQTKDGAAIAEIKDHPAIIISFLEGQGVGRIYNEHMAPLGEVLARMHMAIDGFDQRRPNTLSLPEWKTMAEQVVPRADEIKEGLGDIISDEIAYLEAHWPSDLPSGVIHADLFPDNVFYQQSGADVNLTGVIDFYFACNDFFMYDLAITMNAWCFERRNHHEFNITRTSKLLGGYHRVRPISDAEFHALPTLARGATMRFLLTRCVDWLNPAPGALVTRKDPDEFLRKLQFHQRVKSSSEYGL